MSAIADEGHESKTKSDPHHPASRGGPAIRKIIHTTNAIESPSRVIRNSVRTRGSCPTDAAATRLICLAIGTSGKDGRNVSEWFAARNQFAIMFGERFAA